MGVVVEEDDAMLRAIGTRPDSYLDALAWDHVAEATGPDLDRALEPQGPDLGP
jgi:hypothetical protein